MRRILVGLGIAAVHFLASATSLMFLLADRMGPPPWWEAPLRAVVAVPALVLGLPGIALIPVIPNEYGVMIANSLLWGTGLVFLWDWWTRRRIRQDAAQDGPQGRAVSPPQA